MNWNYKKDLKVISICSLIGIIFVLLILYQPWKFDIKGTITKGLIGKQDLAMWYSGDSAETFTRATSTGYTMTLNKIDWPGVDVCYVFGGGVTKTSAVIAAAIAAVGTTEKVELYLSKGAWPVTGTLNIPANITIHFAIGAYFSSTGTAAFAGSLDSQIKALQGQQIFGADLTVTFCKSGNYYVEHFGILTTNTEVVNTAAYLKLVSAVSSSSGGKIIFGSGTYIGNLNLSNLDNKPTIIEGKGPYNTILTATTGITLDISSSSRVTVRDMKIDSTGGEICLMMTRYSGHIYYGTHNLIENVRIGGSPTVAGLFAAGCELTNFNKVTVSVTSAAPNLYSSVSTTLLNSKMGITYTSPNGTITPTSNTTITYNQCSFIKDSGSTGLNVLIGSYSSSHSFNQCYFHGAPGSSCVEAGEGNIYNILFKGCYLESNYLTAGQTCYGFYFSANSTYHNIVIEDSLSTIKRLANNNYFIYVPTGIFRFCRIRGNKLSYGEVSSIAYIYDSEIEYRGVLSTLSAGATAGDGTISVASASTYVMPGEYIWIGDAYGSEDATAEGHLVSTVVGTTVTLDGTTLASNHISGTYVRMGRLTLTTAYNSRIDTDIPPVITTQRGNTQTRFRKPMTGFITWNPGSLNDGVGETSSSITVAGATLGDYVIVSAPYDLQDCTVTGYVQAANTVEIRLQNESGGVIDLASGTWRVLIVKH